MKLNYLKGRTRSCLQLLGAFSLISIPAAFAQEQEPDYTFDFNTDPGDQIETFGTTEWRGSGGVDDSGYLSITDALNGQNGGVIFEDPTGGKPIEGMKFTIDCRIGGGTDRPADGFSLNIVRPDDPLLQDPRGSGYAGTTDIGAGENNLPEEGSQTGLGIGFDAWVSGGQDIVGISVRVDGEMIEQVAADTLNGEADDVTSLQTGPQSDDDDPLSALTWQPFEAELTPNGDLTVSWKGKAIVETQVNYFPGPGQIVFGGRTGGANQAHHFDNLSLTILAASKAVVSGLSFTRSDVRFQITDGDDSSLDADSVTLIIDGEPAEVVVEKEGLITTVTHTPDPPFQVASIHSYVLAGMDSLGNDIGRSGNFALPVPVFPIDELPGAESEEGFFGTRYIWGGIENPDVGSSQEAVQIIQSVANGNWDGEFFDTLYPVINFNGAGSFGGDLDYPEEVTGSDSWTGDQFIQYSRAAVRFSEAGEFTFGVHSDDGMGLRFLGGPTFISSDGIGGIDNADPSALVFVGPTGDSDTRGVLSVPSPGTYEIEFFWWEADGGDHGELYVTKGAVVGDDDPDASWSLVGQSETVTFNIPGVDATGWTIETSEPGGEEITTLEAGIADLDAGVTTVEGADVFNINDPEAGGPGAFPGDTTFGSNTEVDDNDWAVRATAKLVIPVTGEYQLGFRGDDGGQFKVAGQEFKDIIADATGGAVIEGDTVITDVLTGNSNTIASIDLEAGSYDIEFIGFERGGGAYFEVFGIGAGGPSPVLLAKDGAGAGVLEPSVALVAPPAVRLPVVAFSHDGTNVTLDFEVLDPTAPHLLQSSADNALFADVETTLTQVEGNVFRAVGPALDPLNAYYRVRQLPPPAILEDGFEEGGEGWNVEGGVWVLGKPGGSLGSALSGENVYATGLEDGYPSLAVASLTSPLLDLRGVDNPRLRFFYNQTMGEGEGVEVNFLDESGTELLETDPSSGLVLLGESGGWVEFNRPIPAEARDQQIKILFRLLTDDDMDNDGFGFALDDVRVK